MNSTTPRSRRFLKSFPIFSNRRHVFRRLCPIRGPFIALRQCRRRVNSTTPRSRFLQRLPNLQQCRRWSKHSDFVFKTTMGFSPTLYWLFKGNLNASKPSTFSPVQMTRKSFICICSLWFRLNVLTFPPPAAGELNHTEIKTFPQKFSNLFQSEACFSASLPNQGPVYCLATVPAAGQLNHTEVKISSAFTQFATVPALE